MATAGEGIENVRHAVRSSVDVAIAIYHLISSCRFASLRPFVAN